MTMRLLYIAASDPCTHERAQELLDALLVAASFGAEVSLLFQDDGIWQLLPDQRSDLLGRRSLGAQLDALPLFDVEALYVDAHSLGERNLHAGELRLPVRPLQRDALAALVRAHDQVIRL